MEEPVDTAGVSYSRVYRGARGCEAAHLVRPLWLHITGTHDVPSNTRLHLNFHNPALAGILMDTMDI